MARFEVANLYIRNPQRVVVKVEVITRITTRINMKQKTINRVSVFVDGEYIDIDVSKYNTDDEINQMLEEKYPNTLISIDADITEETTDEITQQGDYDPML